MGVFGQSIKRREDPRFLTGRGSFIDNHKLPGTLHFAVSNGENGNGGDRIDSIVTALDIQGIGGFSITFTERQQKSAGN